MKETSPIADALEKAIKNASPEELIIIARAMPQLSLAVQARVRELTGEPPMSTKERAKFMTGALDGVIEIREALNT